MLIVWQTLCRGGLICVSSTAQLSSHGGSGGTWHGACQCLGSLSRGSGSGPRNSRAGMVQAGLSRTTRLPWEPQGHLSQQGQHLAAGSTTLNPQSRDQDLGPPCKCKGSCGSTCTSTSPRGPHAAHVEAGIPPDLLLHRQQRASPPSPLRRVAALPASTALSVTCLSRM